MHVGIVSFTDVDSGLDLANAIAEAGPRVTFYSSRAHVSRTVGDTNHPIERIYQKQLINKNVDVQLIPLKRMRNPRMFIIMRDLVNIIRNDHIDLVHILMGGGEIWTAILAMLIKHIPVVSTMIIPKPNIGEYPPPWVVILVNRILAFGSQAIIVNGKDHPTLIHKIYHYPSEKVHYIPLGPRSVFLKWCTRDISEENGKILFMGRINKHKGLEFLIKAQPIISAHSPLAQIVIAGEGEDLNRCKEFIENPEKFIILDGFISGKMVAELFQTSSVVVVPYLSAATSAIIMTAYAFGKPVVATRVGSLPEYVRDGETGILVDPADEIQLAEAVIKIITQNDLRHQMGENAQQWIQGELSWNCIAQKTIHVYDNVMDFWCNRQKYNA